MSKKIKVLVILLLAFIIFPKVTLADDGPKPSIDVKIENLKTSNYLIDLFVYDETGEGIKSNVNYGGDGLTDEQISELYELNFDGWISESTRWDYYLLFADCAGNKDHMHHFGYFGTPERYKIVIINNDTGDIKISNEIVRDAFNSNVVIDYNTMGSISTNNFSKTIIIAIVCLVITVLVELLLAFIFKIGNYKIVSITNIITNLCLQLALILIFKNYLLTFVIGELLVLLVELTVYLLKFKRVTKLKTIIYCFTANAVTILISFLLYRI